MKNITRPIAVVGFCLIVVMLILTAFDMTVLIINYLAIICLIPESVRFIASLKSSPGGTD